jgi:signal transduction histidine kinase
MPAQKVTAADSRTELFPSPLTPDRLLGNGTFSELHIAKPDRDPPNAGQRASLRGRSMNDEQRAKQDLIGELVESRRRIAELTEANRRLVGEVQERTRAEEALAKKQRLLTDLLDSSDRERKLMAYEIHDGLAQQLAAAKMHLETAARLQRAKPGESSEALLAASRMLEQGLAEARRLMNEVRPLAIDETGIILAIERLVVAAMTSSGLQIEFRHEVRFGRLPHLVEQSLLRTVQEALTNAARHSRSDRSRIDFVQEGDSIRLEIQDWGIGFDPAGVGEGRLGLEGIRQRAKILGGTAEIDSTPGKGTRIIVRVPLAEIEAQGGGR